MTGFLVRRGLRALATLLLLWLVAQVCLEAAPGEPREVAARVSGLLVDEPGRVSAAERERRLALAEQRHELGPSSAARIADAAGGVFTGDLGRSWRHAARPVTSVLGRTLPLTLGLVATALGLAFAFGLAAAVSSVAARRGAIPRGIDALTALVCATPIAWLAVLALAAFPSATGPLWPVLVMAIVPAAVISRHARMALMLAAREPFATAARARGASELRVLGVHALPRAAAPLCALLPTLVAWLLGAAVVVERAFGLDGLGALLLDAAAVGDGPVVAGATLAGGALVVLATLAGDVGLAWQRQREGGAP